MASLPTGSTSCGFSRSTSAASQREQAAISSSSGTRSPPAAFFAGEAAADGSEVDAVARFVLGPAEGFLQPLEECFARGPREGPAELRLLVARRLADEQDARGHRTPDDHGPVHLRTQGAGAESRKMLPDLGGSGGHVGASLLATLNRRSKRREQARAHK